MTEELKPLDNHTLTQFLTGWGINRAKDLADAVCERFGYAESLKPLDEEAVEQTFDKMRKKTFRPAVSVEWPEEKNVSEYKDAQAEIIATTWNECRKACIQAHTAALKGQSDE